MVNPQERPARGGALFFCLVALIVGLMGLISCSHTSSQTRDTNAAATDSVGSPADESAAVAAPEDSASAPRGHSRRELEELQGALEWERGENQRLKEENDWLRVQVIQLQEALTNANQNIYSLNRKLDAIFKPN